MNIADIRHQLAYRDTAPHRAIDTIKFIVVHHDAVEAPTDYDALALYKREAEGHYNKDWDGEGKADGSGLMYHYKIDRKGNIYFCRNLDEALWHCGNYTKNLQSIAICLDGHLTNQRPTKAQLSCLKEFLIGLCTQHPEFPADFDDVFGHREISATNCPGDNLIKFVQDFRNKKGQVNVDDYPTEGEETPPPTDPCADLRTKCEELEKENQRLAKELKTSQEVQQQTAASLSEISSQLAQKTKELAKSQSSLEVANKTIAEKEETIRKLERKITERDNRIAELEKERTDYRSLYEKTLERDVTKISYGKIVLAILKREQARLKSFLAKLLKRTT